MLNHFKNTVRTALTIAGLLAVKNSYAMYDCLIEETSETPRIILLGDIHKVGDIANIEGDTMAHQLQAEVNIAHGLIKELNRHELGTNLNSVAENYQRQIKEKLWHALSIDHQQKLLSTFCSLEEVKKGLLYEHDLLNNREDPRRVDLYYAAGVFDRPFQNNINFATLKNTSEAENFLFKEGSMMKPSSIKYFYRSSQNVLTLLIPYLACLPKKN